MENGPSDDSSLSVLVVDDNKDSATSMAKLLEYLGFNVRFAFDAKTALEMYTAKPTKIVITDIDMPGMSGHDLAKSIRAKESTVRCKLFALTGCGQEEDRRLSHEAGMDAHLVKPVDPLLLLSLMREETDPNPRP